MTTFKQMIKDGTIKRADAMKVRLQDIHAEPGFNLRIEGEDLEASIDALAEHIKQGGQIPPLEVRPRADGGVWIVDGHRRARAIQKAVDSGALLADAEGVVWVSVVAFNGNDADRVARIITSAEGRMLTSLETAMGYKRLQAFGWDNTRIAQAVGRTSNHVHQLLILANANSDVHELVAAGTVSATLAIDAVRKHGERAGDFLSGQVNKAKAGGKGKATAGTVNGKSLPKKVVTTLVDRTDAFMEAIPQRARMEMMQFEAQGVKPGERNVSVDMAALLDLIRSHNEVAVARENQERRAREKANKAKQTDIEDKAA